MSPRHLTLYSLLFLMLLFAGGGTYLYLQLPALIASQGPSYLADYGVESITSTQPKLAPTVTHLAGLSVRGTHQNYRFAAVLEGVDVSYSASSLYRGELEDIAIKRLRLTLELLPSQTDEQSTSVITLSESLPASVTELLPARSLSIDEVHVRLDTQQQPSLSASGSLSIREALQARLGSTWKGMQLELALNTGDSPANADIDLQLLQDNNKALSLRAISSLTAAEQWHWQLGADIEPGSLLDWLSRPEVRAALPGNFEAPQNVNVSGSITLAGSLQHSDRLDPATIADTLETELEISSADASVRLADGTGTFQTAITAHLSIAPGMQKLDTDFVVDGTFHDQTLPPLTGALSLTGDKGDAQTLTLQVNEPTGTLALQLTGSGQVLQGAGSYRLEATIDQLAAAKSAYIPLTPSDWLPQPLPELHAGSAALLSDFEARGWDNTSNWQWRSRLNIDSLALTYDTYAVDGLSLDLQWLGLEQWQTTAPATLEVEQINVGFPLRDLSVVASLPDLTPPLTPRLQLEQLEVSLLGGRAHLPTAQIWDFASSDNSLLLEVDNLALAQIVALQQSEQISAEGRLSGRLPLTLRGERLIIDSGHLGAAAPGGIIRYLPDEAGAALAGNSPELGMALGLLRNFHYEVLSSEVALDEAGNLLLGLSLAGHNPEYEQGQAVNFNINLEQNIDPLLQSLRLSGSVLEQLEKKQR